VHEHEPAGGRPPGRGAGAQADELLGPRPAAEVGGDRDPLEATLARGRLARDPEQPALDLGEARPPAGGGAAEDREAEHGG
jgi:hypothetical protein